MQPKSIYWLVIKHPIHHKDTYMCLHFETEEMAKSIKKKCLELGYRVEGRPIAINLLTDEQQAINHITSQIKL